MIKSIFIPATLMLCIGILQPIPGQAATQGRNAEVPCNLCSMPDHAIEGRIRRGVRTQA